MKSAAALMMATAIIAFASISVVASKAAAAEQQFDCVLTDTADQLASENHAVSVVIDETTKALKAQDGNRTYNFNKVSMSNIAISGDVASVSIGIDRSSWGIVWQQYEADKVLTEFGHCRQTQTGG